MELETAGDPISGLKWTRKTTEKIADELARLDIWVSARTVAKLLKELKYSLRVNQKKIAWHRGKSRAERRKRNRQFLHIASQRKLFARKGFPIISVDTKKKENLGNCPKPSVKNRASASRFATTRPGLPSGTPLNIDSSPKSARTGPGFH